MVVLLEQPLCQKIKKFFRLKMNVLLNSGAIFFKKIIFESFLCIFFDKSVFKVGRSGFKLGRYKSVHKFTVWFDGCAWVRSVVRQGVLFWCG